MIALCADLEVSAPDQRYAAGRPRIFIRLTACEDRKGAVHMTRHTASAADLDPAVTDGITFKLPLAALSSVKMDQVVVSVEPVEADAFGSVNREFSGSGIRKLRRPRNHVKLRDRAVQQSDLEPGYVIPEIDFERLGFIIRGINGRHSG